MSRVVLDTNVLVSAFVFHGAISALVTLWQNRTITPLVSRAIQLEYLRVLSRPNFHLTAAQIRRLMEEEWLPFVEVIEVRAVPRVVREDPSDDKFLACAVAGQASHLISGDRHLLVLGVHQNIRILTPAEFLNP